MAQAALAINFVSCRWEIHFSPVVLFFPRKLASKTVKTTTIEDPLQPFSNEFVGPGLIHPILIR